MTVARAFYWFYATGALVSWFVLALAHVSAAAHDRLGHPEQARALRVESRWWIACLALYGYMAWVLGGTS